VGHHDPLINRLLKPDRADRAAWLALLTAAVTLFVQVLFHRIVSAKLLNNYAFLVISLTMLGFAASSVLLARFLSAVLANLDDAISIAASSLTLLAMAAAGSFYQADIDQFALLHADLVKSLVIALPYVLLLALPFACCGLILGALLAAPGLPTRRIYCFDLVGSALGAAAVVPAIAHLGVEWSLLLACALLWGAALLLATPRGRPARLLAAGAAVMLALGVVFPSRMFDMVYPAGSMLGENRRLGPPYGLEYTQWDPVARIEVSRIPPPAPERITYPSLVGTNPAFLSRFERILTQNNFAFTFAVRYDGSVSSLRGIEETIYAAAYEASSVRRPRVAIVGVGGGFDVLTALRYDAAQVTAVEINQATVDILRDVYRAYFQAWVSDPRVDIVVGEGRHELARRAARYDVLQLSGVDSYSGTAGAAHVFSENYLYTAEAFDLCLSRLTEQGILNMMRLEQVPPRDMLRAAVSATAALRRAGVGRPEQHVVMIAAKPIPNFTALLVKRTPFLPAEIERVERWAETSPYFEVVAAPGRNADKKNNYSRFLRLGDERREAQFVASAPFDIRPVDDDRPFFFHFSYWRHLFSRDPLILYFPPVMERSVLVLLAVVGLAAVGCIWAPLRHLRRDAVAPRGVRRYGLFFACTALGYMAVEIALLQKFGLLLGHPNHALSFVLAALLLTTGIGSLLCRQIVARLGGRRFVSYVLALVVLAEYALALPRLSALVTASFATRSAVVFALVAPLGVLLGTFLPSALEQLKADSAPWLPWAWGVNGIFSVLGPILSVAFSMTWGINALLLSAVPVYLLAGLALPESPLVVRMPVDDEGHEIQPD